MSTPAAAAETFTEDERRVLSPYFTNADRHVFALTNLPETVKGALFARYSRSAKSLRRLFLDEFARDFDAAAATPSSVGIARAEKLYAKVFNEYGDDSVAQLGGAHLACEYVSNVLTKVLERGRLMAYLEQSTRYVPYTDRLHGRWRYHIPAEIQGTLRELYVRNMDRAFETYASLIDRMQAYFAARYPRAPDDSEAVHRSAVRAKALDTLRGMLPAATQSNVGIYASGQAFEALLLRMRAHPLEEVRMCAGQMLTELRQVIPAFLTRVDQPDRGGRWSEYFAEQRAA
ncbi:MAG TPA: FAD-dependent thymidylate synthase, partial [Vicinamibacterales bacterium]